MKNDDIIITELPACEKETSCYDTVQKKTNIFIIVSVCITLILTVAIGMTMYIKHQEKLREEERLAQIKLQATGRVDDLCDNLYCIEIFDDASDYVKATETLAEIDKLINENMLTDKKEKFNDVQSYVEDLNTFRFISANIYSSDKTILQEVDSKIKTLTNAKVTSKLPEYYSTLEGHARNIIWNNFVEGCQRSVFDKGELIELKNTYVYNEDYGSHLLSERGDECTISASAIGRVFKSNTYTHFFEQSVSIPSKAWNDITSNGRKGVIVEYLDDSEKWFHYWYIGYNVKAAYVNGQMLYDVTVYERGEPRIIKPPFQEIVNYALQVTE